MLSLGSAEETGEVATGEERAAAAGWAAEAQEAAGVDAAAGLV